MDERLGIVGAGAIARGLATTAATHGDVVLWARSEGSAERARASMARSDAPRVSVVTDLDALDDATFLVEAVVEDLEAKGTVLAELGRRAAPHAVLATTTSSLPVAELGRRSARPERFVALHVFHPVPKMPLVELAFTPETEPDARERARALCVALEKTAVEVPDIPGFVVNRLLFPFLFSAVVLLDETGLDPAAVDTCLKLGAGHPMGPLALLDLVGLDVSEAIGDEIGVAVPPRLRGLVAAGALGRKTGRGFHAYE